LLNIRNLGVATDLIEIDTDGKRLHIGRPAPSKNPKMFMLDLRFYGESDCVQEVVAVVLYVEAQ
jgi:hypothetical protein